MTDPAQAHIPVLREEIVDLLAPALDAAERPVVIDATLGMGGHSEALLERFADLQIIGVDRDPAALELAGRRLERFAPRVRFVHAVYDEIDRVLDDLGLDAVDGVLFDLGVSSLQLDLDERGFSYARDTLLDMRMDPTVGQTAADVLNTYSVAELTRVLRDYGEERFAHRIATRVVKERDDEPFARSARLVDLVRESIPAATRRTGGNPAKRTFQALRIEVNTELSVLGRALPAAIAALPVGGRIVVMSYQSLEDKITKTVLTGYSTSSAPPDLPVVPDDLAPTLKLLTRGALTASPAEIEANPRAASVRVRAGVKLRPGLPQGPSGPTPTTDRRKPDRKQADHKRADHKRADRQQAERKQTDRKQTDRRTRRKATS